MNLQQLRDSGLPHEVSSEFINELITNIRIDNYEQQQLG